jgi:hypothetical protein
LTLKDEGCPLAKEEGLGLMLKGEGLGLMVKEKGLG